MSLEESFFGVDESKTNACSNTFELKSKEETRIKKISSMDQSHQTIIRVTVS